MTDIFNTIHNNTDFWCQYYLPVYETNWLERVYNLCIYQYIEILENDIHYT